MSAVDPWAILGVESGAPPDELARAYRELAKRHHPDRAGAQAAARMAQINAAYDLLKAQVAASARPAPSRERRSAGPGSWLAPELRRWLAPELLGELRPGEPVRAVARGSTPDSPRAQVAITERRMLWLRDELVLGRVRSVPLASITRVHTRAPSRWRTGRLTIEAGGRRRHFYGLDGLTLGRLAAAIDAGRATRAR